MYNPNFDIDLKFGEVYEEFLKELLKAKDKIEVKTERDKWVGTGNIAIEYKCRGKLSGISVTKADWWVHILTLKGEVVAMFWLPVKNLKSMCKTMLDDNRVKKVKGGDDNASEMLLVPIENLASQIRRQYV